MLRRFGLTGTLAVAGAMVTMMAFASAGGAATPERPYGASFTAACVIAPNVLNVKVSPIFELRFDGPEEVAERQSGIDFNEASAKLKLPPSIEEGFIAIGIHAIRGRFTKLTLDATNMEPRELNIGKPIAGPLPYPQGLPFEAIGERIDEVVFPKEGTFSFGPYNVTGRAGENATLSIDGRPAFAPEEEGGYRITGNGIVLEYVGLNVEGEEALGPFPIVCNAPSTQVASIPIVAGTATTEEAEYNGSALSGSITDAKLGQTLTLPAGSTFTGSGQRNLASGQGSIHGNVSIPAFSTSFKLLGVIPASLGVTLTEAEPVSGTIHPTEGPGGLEQVSLPMKLNLGVSSLRLLGLSIPTSCATAEPSSLLISGAFSVITGPPELLNRPLGSTGTTTIAKLRCGGGLLGALFGSVVSELLAGGGNSYTLGLAAPTKVVLH